MGARTEHTPGTFSYDDLSTTDPDAAKAFYGELFGWGFDDQEVGEGVVYTTCRIDGATVCAVSAQIEQERQIGVPPHWNRAGSRYAPILRAPSSLCGRDSWRTESRP